MLRVTRIDTPDVTTLKLEGKLAGPWVDEVRHCWTKLAEEKARVCVYVDLHGLSFLDASGKTLLLQMERQGSELVGGSTFIRCLLHPVPLRRARSHSESISKES
jgi:anti-anti-sigma regulatory factor